MERNKPQKSLRETVFSTRNLVMMAVLIAIQIILSRFFCIQTETLRISFESIPLILAGMWLGPVCGGITAIIADFLGTLIQGFVWFPPLMVGPVFVAVFSGICTRYIFRNSLGETKDTWKVIVTVVCAGVINSFFFGLIGSTLYSIMIMGNTTAFPALLGMNFIQRLATKPITIGVDAVVVAAVNRAVYKPVVSHILSRA